MKKFKLIATTCPSIESLGKPDILEVHKTTDSRVIEAESSDDALEIFRESDFFKVYLEEIGSRECNIFVLGEVKQ